jgi:hypothetical protein
VTPDNTKTPQARCYHAIHHLFTDAMAQYALKNQQLLRDNDLTTLAAANSALVKLLEQVLLTLDEFAIADRPPAKTGAGR